MAYWIVNKSIIGMDGEKIPVFKEEIKFMKIAVASDDGFVAAHFGSCSEFVLFTIGLRDKIVEKVIIPSPGHQKRGFLPGFLAQMGVTHVISGGMGHLARRLFAEMWIITVVGASGPVDRVVEDFLANNLVVGENPCPHFRTCQNGNGSSCEDKLALQGGRGLILC